MSKTKIVALLASFSPDTQRAIFNYCNSSGSAGLTEVAAASNQNGLPVFAMVDYIDESDFPEFWTGLCVLMMAQLRTPRFDSESYANALKDAFSLPSEMARSIADKIETYDVLQFASGASTWEKVSAHTKEVLRRITTPISKGLGLPWTDDQEQKWDVDFLYEVKLLGRAVRELNSRARMMTSQTRLQSALGLFGTDTNQATGDIAETGDVDPFDVAMGDALYPLMGAPVPSAAFGAYKRLAQLGEAASLSKVANITGGAVQHRDDQSVVHTNPKKQGQFGSFLKKIGTSKVAKGVLMGSGLGLVTGLVSGLLGKKKGDPEEDLMYGDIASEYGEPIAEAMLSGDVDTVAYHILQSVADTPNAGDVDDSLAVEAMGDLTEDEAANADIETGGLFTRWRINRLRKKAERRNRRATRRMRRRNKKARAAEELDYAREAADNAGYENNVDAQEAATDPQGGMPTDQDSNGNMEVENPEFFDGPETTA